MVWRKMSAGYFKRLGVQLKAMFVQSSRLHLHQNPASDTRELVYLFDRFLNRSCRYPLEWDDFISWENSNAHVEEIRNRLGQFEPLLFSKDKADRALYREKVDEERNRLARLLGISVRDISS
jgi:hypothetical protein